jgi:hypothetical protein
MFFLNVMPLVDLGLINLLPDPCDFDFHLRQQMPNMARARAPRFGLKDDLRLQKTMEEDHRRGIMLMPPDAMRLKLRELKPGYSEEEVEAVMRAGVKMREDDLWPSSRKARWKAGKAVAR